MCVNRNCEMLHPLWCKALFCFLLTTNLRLAPSPVQLICVVQTFSFWRGPTWWWEGRRRGPQRSARRSWRRRSLGNLLGQNAWVSSVRYLSSDEVACGVAKSYVRPRRSPRTRSTSRCRPVTWLEPWLSSFLGWGWSDGRRAGPDTSDLRRTRVSPSDAHTHTDTHKNQGSTVTLKKGMLVPSRIPRDLNLRAWFVQIKLAPQQLQVVKFEITVTSLL